MITTTYSTLKKQEAKSSRDSSLHLLYFDTYRAHWYKCSVYKHDADFVREFSSRLLNSITLLNNASWTDTTAKNCTDDLRQQYTFYVLEAVTWHVHAQLYVMYLNNREVLYISCLGRRGIVIRFCVVYIVSSLNAIPFHATLFLLRSHDIYIQGLVFF